jgi:large subunit ribosomal protein L18
MGRRKKEKMLKLKKERRRRRSRVKIFGTKDRPRLSVFRSNKHLYLQLIDDEAGKTICSLSDLALKDKKNKIHVTVAEAEKLGILLAEKALAQGIKKIVFDRGPYKFHGRVKAIAEGARQGGLIF